MSARVRVEVEPRSFGVRTLLDGIGDARVTAVCSSSARVMLSTVDGCSIYAARRSSEPSETTPRKKEIIFNNNNSGYVTGALER